MNIDNSFGAALRKLRGQHSLRQIEQWAGISNSYLAQIENGKRGIPSVKLLSKLAHAYGIKAEEMICLTEKNVVKYVNGHDGLTVEHRLFIRLYKNLPAKSRKYLRDTLNMLVKLQ